MPRARRVKCQKPKTVKAKLRRMKRQRLFKARQSLKAKAFQSPRPKVTWPASEEESKSNLISNLKSHFDDFPLLDLQEMNSYIKELVYTIFGTLQESKDLLSLSYQSAVKTKMPNQIPGISITISTMAKDICKGFDALSINNPDQRRCKNCHKLEHKKRGANSYKCVPCLKHTCHPVLLGPWPFVSFPTPNIKNDDDVFAYLAQNRKQWMVTTTTIGYYQ